MKVPSELALGQDYAIFKNNIRPMWEDAANIHGGRWLISFDKKRNINIDNIWLFVVSFFTSNILYIQNILYNILFFSKN